MVTLYLHEHVYSSSTYFLYSEASGDLEGTPGGTEAAVQLANW